MEEKKRRKKWVFSNRFIEYAQKAVKSIMVYYLFAVSCSSWYQYGMAICISKL